ncbi:MAG TPA: hypothetical protein VMV68_00320, partial [Spirochaetia bacterium]|nr:hypothetical protein [Spirochaetia bacterium]
MSFVRVAISVGLLLAAPMLFADNAQKIIPVESDVYTALTALYLEEGFAPPSQALPYSVEELQEALGRIDRSRLSAAGKKTYDFVESFFSHGTTYREGKNLEFSSAALVTVAGYAQTNPAAQGASAEPEWVKRPPLVDVPLELWLWSSFYAYLSIPLMQDRFVAQPPSQLPAAGGPGWPAGFSGNPTNIPLSV